MNQEVVITFTNGIGKISIPDQLTPSDVTKLVKTLELLTQSFDDDSQIKSTEKSDQSFDDDSQIKSTEKTYWKFGKTSPYNPYLRGKKHAFVVFQSKFNNDWLFNHNGVLCKTTFSSREDAMCAAKECFLEWEGLQ